MSFKTVPSLAHKTAKAGVIAMTRQLAMEGREYALRATRFHQSDFSLSEVQLTALLPPFPEAV
jgi:NAD(P)-dependent dehydrogenase (short-subunit alcohol dehydrogenase family)